MTKLVTAVAVMKLVESKAVDLDAPITRYLPEFPSAYGMTVRNLLTHSSGLPDPEADHLVAYGTETMPRLDDVLTRFLAGLKKLDFAPGTSSAYSNWNYLALGVLVERVARMPFESFVTQSILRPLGMEHTVFRYADEPAGTSVASPIIPAEREPGLVAVLGINRPALDAEKIAVARSGGRTYLTAFDILAPWGGLMGPADELTRFLDLHLGTAGAAGSQILSSKTLSSMRQVQRARDGQPLGWALGWVVRTEKGETLAEHGGGGPGIDDLMRIYPDRHLGIVVMANVNDYGVGRIMSAAAAILTKEAR
jgi:CubicO group peptidase (beta-lactamase class C family)